MNDFDDIAQQAPPAFTGMKESRPRRRGWLGPYLLGVLSGVVLVFGITGIAVVGLIIHFNIEPEGIEASVQGPGSAAIGDEVRIVLQVRNDGAEARTIREVDVGASLLEGVYIEATEPEFHSWAEDATLGFESEVYYFDGLHVGAGRTQEIVIVGQAMQAGFYAGDIDVFFEGTSGRYVSRVYSIRIGEGNGAVDDAKGAPPF